MKYFLKTKGTLKIPDYLQIRDEEFQLIAHCTVNKALSTLEEQGINLGDKDVLSFIEQLPFGKLTKVEEY